MQLFYHLLKECDIKVKKVIENYVNKLAEHNMKQYGKYLIVVN